MTLARGSRCDATSPIRFIYPMGWNEARKPSTVLSEPFDASTSHATCPLDTINSASQWASRQTVPRVMTRRPSTTRSSLLTPGAER